MTKYDINTERLCLKPVDDNDIEEIFSLFSNPNVTRWTKAKTHKNIEETQKLITNTLEQYKESLLWAIKINNSSLVIGLLHFFISTSGKAEIHYVLAEDYWNKGIMTEVVNAILIWIEKQYPKIESVYTEPAAENIGSCRVLEKCGFKKVNRRCVRWEKFYPHFVNLNCYELKLR